MRPEQKNIEKKRGEKTMRKLPSSLARSGCPAVMRKASSLPPFPPPRSHSPPSRPSVPPSLRPSVPPSLRKPEVPTSRGNITTVHTCGGLTVSSPGRLRGRHHLDPAGQGAIQPRVVAKRHVVGLVRGAEHDAWVVRTRCIRGSARSGWVGVVDDRAPHNHFGPVHMFKSRGGSAVAGPPHHREPRRPVLGSVADADDEAVGATTRRPGKVAGLRGGEGDRRKGE